MFETNPVQYLHKRSVQCTIARVLCYPSMYNVHLIILNRRNKVML